MVPGFAGTRPLTRAGPGSRLAKGGGLNRENCGSARLSVGAGWATSPVGSADHVGTGYLVGKQDFSILGAAQGGLGSVLVPPSEEVGMGVGRVRRGHLPDQPGQAARRSAVVPLSLQEPVETVVVDVPGSGGVRVDGEGA